MSNIIIVSIIQIAALIVKMIRIVIIIDNMVVVRFVNAVVLSVVVGFVVIYVLC